MAMNLLVIGAAGCIGSRRKALLEDMGHNVTGVDKETVLTQEFLKTFDAVFITVPPYLHVPIGLEAAAAGRPFMVEKPGAGTAEEFAPLVNAAEVAGVVSMVACNMRFTDEYRYIKDALPAIGKPVYAYAECGFYLPFWRPGEYKNYYSCYRSQGGGVLLDSIHELDYLFDLFGAPHGEMGMFAQMSRTGELQGDVEDTATICLTYPERLTVVCHLDYLQRTYTRKFHCVGTNGAVDMVFNLNKSGLMYRREMNHFLESVKAGRPTCQSVRDHWKLLKFVDEVKRQAVSICK